MLEFTLTNWLLRNPEVHYHSYIRANSIQSPASQPASLKSILILSSHVHPGFPRGLSHSGFPTKILYAFLDCSIQAMCCAHLSPLDLKFLIMLGEEYNAFSSELYSSPLSGNLGSLSPIYLSKYFILESP